MADAVTTQILSDGPRNAVLKFTNISDGTGESAALKVDPPTLLGAPAQVTIERVIAMTSGMAVDVLFDATTDVLALHIPDLQCCDLDFRPFGGIPNNAGAGKTGDILFTTIGAAAGDRYTIILWLKKD